MANTPAAAATSPRGNHKDAAFIEVDPQLLRTIESASAPTKVPKPTLPPASMPGTLSAIAGSLNLIDFLRRGMASATDNLEKYGDIYRVSVAGVPMVIVWDADEIHKIVKNEDQIWSTAMGWNAAVFDGIDTRSRARPGERSEAGRANEKSGNAGTLVTLDFEDHRAARKLVQPAFTLHAIDGYLKTAGNTFASTLEEWTRNGQVDFKREIRTLLARVAGDIFTGIRDPKTLATVDVALAHFWRSMVAMSRNPWLSPTFRRARKGFETLLRTFVALVPERRKSGGEDLFSHMCAATDDTADDEAIARIFISIMFGAFDTTSAAMTSMAYLLAKHPRWQDRLREEAQSVRADSAGIDSAAMKNMKQHEWVWKETLRLMPVAGYVPRAALRRTVVGGHSIEPGVLVMPMVGGIGRHPKWWKKPDTFDPERFSPERAEDKQHPAIYNPFGAGAHACVGMQLANLEMKAFWHRALTTFRFHLKRDYKARHTFTPMGMVSGKVSLVLERV